MTERHQLACQQYAEMQERFLQLRSAFLNFYTSYQTFKKLPINRRRRRKDIPKMSRRKESQHAL